MKSLLLIPFLLSPLAVFDSPPAESSVELTGCLCSADWPTAGVWTGIPTAPALTVSVNTITQANDDKGECDAPNCEEDDCEWDYYLKLNVSGPSGMDGVKMVDPKGNASYDTTPLDGFTPTTGVLQKVRNVFCDGTRGRSFDVYYGDDTGTVDGEGNPIFNWTLSGSFRIEFHCGECGSGDI